MKVWEYKYSIRLMLTDFVVISLVTTTAQLLRFGANSPSIIEGKALQALAFNYTLTSATIVIFWMAALSLFNSRKREILGAGSEEYRRVVRATFALFAVVAIISYLGNLQIARGYVLIAMPLGLVFLLFSRWAWRQWLIRTRSQGSFLTPAVVIGSINSADEVSLQLAHNSEAGFQVLGCFLNGSLPPSSQSQQILLPKSNLPILGGFDNAIKVMREIGANTIIVANSDHLSPRDVRSLSWELIPGQENLVLAPSLLDVSGPRLHMYPVANMPLIRVETPNFSGGRRVLKRIFDLLASLLLLILFSPIFAIIAIAIKRDSAGPIFFTQERVGLHGKTFKMIKFRTMSASAESELKALQNTSVVRDAGNHILFKIKDDPRITPIGKTLRKYSLDELPQLINVLKDNMSLVGPRPPLPSEVALYDDHVMRKFFMKPGITGQWQVSGRSDLNWDDSVRADLMYVENWSFVNDLLILWKTTRAVVKSSGAY